MDKKEQAKKIPIQELYPDSSSLRQFGTKLRGKCPIHKDTSTPNFFIYTETNTFFCFAGCGGGDSISFYMKLNKVDFKTAIKQMI